MILDCEMAMTFPAAMDNRERMISIPCQSRCRGCRPSISRRIAMANAATFGAVARNSVTAVGEPSYTSGNQEWNGTAPSLNAMPTTTKTSPEQERYPVVYR